MKILSLLFVFIVWQINLFGQTIPQSLPTIENGWQRIQIEFLGSIDLPPNMEIQNGVYKQITETVKEINGIAASKIIFQQKNLNALDKNSFNTYARVFIRTEIGTIGDYKKLKSAIFTTSEVLEINNDYKNQIQQGLSGANAIVLEWYQAKFITINGMSCITFGYKRQVGSNPPVNVTFYLFHNNDRIHILTFEYRIADENTWKPTFQKIISSFRITTFK